MIGMGIGKAKLHKNPFLGRGQGSSSTCWMISGPIVSYLDCVRVASLTEYLQQGGVGHKEETRED